MMINAVVLLCAAGLIAVDQILKAWMLELLSGGPIMLIPGLLQLTYVENRGAAFGIFQGRVQILSIITAVVLIAAVVLLLMGKFKHPVELWSIGLIIAGGAGNLIDRIARGFVIDYLDISPLFSFPVFNLADCCVVVGTCVLAFYLIMIDGKEPKKSGGESAAVGEIDGVGEIAAVEEIGEAVGENVSPEIPGGDVKADE